MRSKLWKYDAGDGLVGLFVAESFPDDAEFYTEVTDEAAFIAKCVEYGLTGWNPGDYTYDDVSDVDAEDAEIEADDVDTEGVA